MRLDTKMRKLGGAISIVAFITGALALSAQEMTTIHVAPSTMPKLGTVDARFVSYNVEMVEVTGGRFWKPYKSAAAASTSPVSPSQGNQQVGMDTTRFQYRPPIDLANPKLRKLAAALGPDR